MTEHSSSLHPFPVLPLSGQVLFPSAIATLTVERADVRAAVQAAYQQGSRLALIAMRNPDREVTGLSDLFSIGTAATVQHVAKLTDDGSIITATIRGEQRLQIREQLQTQPYLVAEAEPLPEIPLDEGDPEQASLKETVRSSYEELVNSSPSLSNQLARIVGKVREGRLLSDLIASSLPSLSWQTQQELLETPNVRDRLKRLLELLSEQQQESQLRDRIREQAAEQMGHEQREQFLREQLKAIQKELGEGDEPQRDLDELREQLRKAGLPDEARKEADRELARLHRIPQASPEYSVTRTYLEWLASLPWQHSTAEPVDLGRARAILDEDHYDLDDVKERILEYLAVYRLKGSVRGPILCFLGPPGVGKTSVGRSIARATGRAFVRVSLGGTHDESEIRGHRRTYVGALPGQIIRGLRRAGTNDPVFMIDEVDKLGTDVRGDPAAALLEVLDPEQNATFRDHYLDVPFDLSRVLFIATANLLDPIRPALRDRMETIELPGYVDEEKLHIAEEHLVPKQLHEHGLDGEPQIHFRRNGLETIISYYTHEAGVRDLERHIGAVCRKRAKQIVQDPEPSPAVELTPDVVRELLGVPRFRMETQLLERTRVPGVAVAVAWTASGGDLLFIEAAPRPGEQGELTITGQVREVMQESARTAMSWLHAYADQLDIERSQLRELGVHIHVPAGAVPKEGPSAGIVMLTALVSLLRKRPVRPYLAMTGEITLSGLLLPVGGVKEKVLTAKRNGVREMVLPEQNRANVVEEVPEHLRDGIELRYVSTILEALEIAFEPHDEADRTSPHSSPPHASV